ncbi:SapC family protein [Aurantimonas sp. VKM B-3413]|uniref:SapC family protein n=1 Tax=Aurantimonas sp. VKM B-3413 TaxID=2779401 RepID=UPI001E2C0C51|nr:SapC family protein [Aurantimonas sp. VKM B-3413]MCB8836490.1 SapC family protein [Aurantimonas sp. VKM B-3413]
MPNSIYTSFLEFDVETSKRRLYAPNSYRSVREASLVPVVTAEALSLAAFFPLVWSLEGDHVELMALRSLIPLGRAQLPDTLRIYKALPLLLQAFPLRLMPESPRQFGLDGALPDRPTDTGAPIFTPQRTLSRGADIKLRALSALKRSLDETQAISQALWDLEMLMEWQLPLDGIAHAEVGPLFVVSTEPSVLSRQIELATRFGADAMLLVAAHRISLYRTGPLLTAARGLSTKGALETDVDAAPVSREL